MFYDLKIQKLIVYVLCTAANNLEKMKHCMCHITLEWYFETHHLKVYSRPSPKPDLGPLRYCLTHVLCVQDVTLPKARKDVVKKNILSCYATSNEFLFSYFV